MVLAERLDAHRDAGPARRPVDPPGQLAAAAHRDAAAPAAGARVIDRLGLLGEALDDRVAHLAARLTDRIERAPGGFHLPAGALGQDAGDGVATLERLHDLGHHHPGLVHLVGIEDLHLDPQTHERGQERFEEMCGVRRMAAAGAGDLRQRLADVVLIDRRVQERVDLAQGVEVVGHVVERDLHAALDEDTVDDVGGDHLAQVANVDLAGRRDAGGDLVRAGGLPQDAVGDLVGPVRLTDVNHPAAVPRCHRPSGPATKRKRTLIASSMTSHRKRGIGIP